MYISINFRCLLDKKKVDLYFVDMKDKCLNSFDKNIKLEQIEMIQEIINKLGFDMYNISQKLDRKTFERNINDVTNNCQLFVDTDKSQLMFRYDKKKIINIETIRQFMGFVNSLLSEWGVIISTIKEYKSTKIDNKWCTSSIIKYKLNYINNINP